MESFQSLKLNAEYHQAAEVSCKAMKLAHELARPGVSIRDIAIQVDSLIFEHDCIPSFPTLVNVNDWAAHFAPSDSCDITLQAGDVVKFDLGASKAGYLCDMARTVEIGNTHRYDVLIRASESAFKQAFEHLSEGITNRKISEIIHDEVRRNNVVPIDDLLGHRISRFHLHDSSCLFGNSRNAGMKLPEVMLQPGWIIALEPFASIASSRTTFAETNASSVLTLIPMKEEKHKRISKELHEFYQLIFDRFQTLPIAPRWCRDITTSYEQHCQELIKAGLARSDSPIIERTRGFISHHENTIHFLGSNSQILTEFED